MMRAEKLSHGAKSIQTASIWSEFELESQNSFAMERLQFEDDQEKMTLPKNKSSINSKRSNLSQPWTSWDEEKLLQLHKEMGNKWSNLARFFPGMSENSIKNRFYSRLRKSIRKLNKAIQMLKLKQYNKFKLNIIFQLSNISESKLLEKDKVSSQIFQFYKEFLYELIEFSNQNLHSNRLRQSYDQTKSEIESLILPLIALENLFRLVRGERAAKGKKKNIAYLRQFSFKLSLQIPIFMIITKENTYIQNLNQNPNIEVSQQQDSQHNEDLKSSLNTESSFEKNTLVRKSSMSQSYDEKELFDKDEKDNCPKMMSLNTFIQQQSFQNKTKPQMWKDYFGCEMKEIDFYCHEDQIHDQMNQFHMINLREVDFSEDDVCL